MIFSPELQVTMSDAKSPQMTREVLLGEAIITNGYIKFVKFAKKEKSFIIFETSCKS